MRIHNWIKAAAKNDREVLIDGIKTIHNCREADVSADGGIWIAKPQAGHWLDTDRAAEVVRALKVGI
jgi:hypothetical protein